MYEVDFCLMIFVVKQMMSGHDYHCVKCASNLGLKTIIMYTSIRTYFVKLGPCSQQRPFIIQELQRGAW